MSEKREFTGVFIPAHIWISKELIPAEKMILGEVDALSKRNGWCDASRNHFADWLGCTPQNVTYFFQKLERLGFIETVAKPGYRTKRRLIPGRFYENEIGVNPTDGGGKGDLRVGVNPTDGGGKGDLPEIKDKVKREIKGKIDSSSDFKKADLIGNLELKKENPPPPIPPDPPPPNDDVPKFHNPDLLEFLDNYLIRENFCRNRRVPSEKYEDYLEAFDLEIATTQEPHTNRTQLIQHFLNFSAKRHEKEMQEAEKARITAQREERFQNNSNRNGKSTGPRQPLNPSDVISQRSEQRRTAAQRIIDLAVARSQTVGGSGTD